MDADSDSNGYDSNNSSSYYSNNDSNDNDSSKNDNNGRRSNKRAKLYKASSRHHSAPQKKRAVECRIDFSYKNYWGNVSSRCNRHANDDSNCLLLHYENDLNKLRIAAQAKRDTLVNLTKKEHYEIVHNNLSTLSSKKNNTNSHIDYKVMVDQGVHVSCCKECYMRFNYITKSLLEKSKKINKKGNGIDINKRKERENSDGPFVEMNGTEFRKMLTVNKINNPQFHEDFLPFAFAPNGDDKELCLQWTNNYFFLYGDQQPDSETTYMSESFKKDIYQQYKDHMERLNLRPVSKDTFNRIWINCFPYVQLREECNIIGKCKVCAKSAQLRTSKKEVDKQAGKDMHMFHRCLFKPERCAYQSRILHALENPMKIFSLCIDIMDSYTLGTPYAGTQYKFNKCFDSVIVGAYVHGDSTSQDPAHWKRLRLYRTWNTVGKSCNLIIHVFLQALEEWIKIHKGQTPDIIYLQVDGGSENANNAFLSILQLVVNKNLCNQLVFSRLPTGHGHTDGDGGFGIIKQIIRDCVLAGWDSFEKEVMKRLGDGLSALNCSVENIYIVNDWETYIKPYQAEFSALHKLELTQHQILFERIESHIDYPFQVKISVRAYCSERVIELIPAPRPSTELGRLTGFDPVDLLVKWFSVSEEGNILTFLKDIPPATKLPFLPLLDNCVKLIDEVVQEIMTSNFSIITTEIKQNYRKWRSDWLPSENDVMNLEGYADRIHFLTPLVEIWEADNVYTFMPGNRIEAKITTFNDEEFNNKYEALLAVSIASLRLDQPSTRAFKISSEIAESIMNKTISKDQFKSFQEVVKQNRNTFATFYGEQCKYGLHNILKYSKPKVVAATSDAVTTFLKSFLVLLYTPLLPSYVSHVERMIAGKNPDDCASYVTIEGKRVKILVKQVTSFNVTTLNLLMLLFNARETEIYKVHQSQTRPFNYKKVYFQPAETIADVFNPLKTAALETLEMFSKVIFPYRIKLLDGRFSVNLIIMLPKEKRLYFLDPVRDRNDTVQLLPAIKQVFDRYYSQQFDIELYSTVPMNIQIDSYAKLQFLSNDEPYIHMYIMIYYVLFGCPLIFDFDDINTTHIKNRIQYELMSGELSI